MIHIENYPYLYETHLHTAEGSLCAKNKAIDMAWACKRFGYTGIFVTDHAWGGYTRADRNLPWSDWINQFSIGYREAKAWGERNGFDVFFGWEAGFFGTEYFGAEFLVYGTSPQWMLQHPELAYEIAGAFRGKSETKPHLSPKELSDLVHEAGGIIVYAHPFRKQSHLKKPILFTTDIIDGVEYINAAHTHYKNKNKNNKSSEYNKKAIDFGRKYNMFSTAGSDIHSSDLFGAGMAFRRRLESGEDFVQALKSGDEYILCDGEHWYDKDEYIEYKGNRKDYTDAADEDNPFSQLSQIKCALDFMKIKNYEIIERV